MAALDVFEQISTSFATVSLNNQGVDVPHLDIETKLRAISEAGFQQVELGFPDILAFASARNGRDIAADDYDTLVVASKEIKSFVNRYGLKILMLQPFSNFEGWPTGSSQRADAFKRAEGWIRIMQAVGTDMLQVGSTDTPSPPLSVDRAELSRDLAELADMLAPQKFRICYENWCFATHGRTWDQVWTIVQSADRSNIGLCLDTFQEAGAQWADPTTKSGMIESVSEEELNQKYRESLQDMVAAIPQEKIFVLQISDGYLPTPRIEDKLPSDGIRPRGRWCMAYRPMPYDNGYLPIVPMTSAVLKTGFRGCFSVEVFDGGPDGRGKKKDAESFTKQAMLSLRKLVGEALT